MRTYGPTLAQHFADRKPVRLRSLIWITARNRVTGAAETMGLWNGDDHMTFTIAGQARTYYAAGSLIDVDDISGAVGIEVRMQSAVLSPLTPEVAQAIRGYDARLAPIEIHRAAFDPDSHVLMDEPHRVFTGWIDGIDLTEAADGENAECRITMSSVARDLTRTLPLKRSDAGYSLRSGDRIARYADVSANVPVFWGEGVVSAPPPASKPPRPIGVGGVGKGQN